MSATHFDRIAPRYDLLNDLVSAGLHRRWKKMLAEGLRREVRRPVATLLDVSTGTGDVLMALRKEFPGAELMGLDPSRPMLAQARQRDLNGVRFLEASSEAIPLPSQSVDAVTCAFGVRNFSDRATSFREWSRILRPGGVAAILEIHPLPRAWYRPGLVIYWNRLVPVLGGLFGHGDAYTYLRDSSASFPTRERMVAEAQAQGLDPSRSVSLFARGMVSLSFLRVEGNA